MHDLIPFLLIYLPVRRNAVRCAPHPRAAPISRANARRYVPALTVARNCRSGTAASTISSSRISTGRGAGTTASPRGERRKARRAPDQQHQQSFGERVERAQVSDPIFPQRAADDVDDIMRRRAGGLGDQHEPPPPPPPPPPPSPPLLPLPPPPGRCARPV